MLINSRRPIYPIWVYQIIKLPENSNFKKFRALAHVFIIQNAILNIANLWLGQFNLLTYLCAEAKTPSPENSGDGVF